MKLVDILARELKEWPNTFGEFCICTKTCGSFAAWFNERRPKKDYCGGWSDIGRVEKWLTFEPEDRNSAVVTRAEWQAAVDALSKPAVPEWNGEGLPPVGIRLEMAHKDAQPDWARPGFYESKILAMGEQLMILEADGSGLEKVGKISDYHFRPIRTPEQIAAEERELRISFMADDYRIITGREPCAYVREAFRAIESAGYRKQEQN